jgi:type I restriction-modification system DNA methylase subunit
MSKWFDLNLDQINIILEDALNHYKIKSSFRFKEINDENLKRLLYKMSNLPPKSKAYNDAILSIMAKGKAAQGIEFGTSKKFKDVLVDIVKSMDIKPEKIADLTAGYGFTLRDLAMINDKSKVLGVEINERVTNYNKILNVITGLGNIDVLNEDSLAYNFKEEFDLISIRPPFGMMGKKNNNYNFEVLNKSRRNLSDAFIEQAINLTKENGYIIAVVTEGTLFTRRSKVLREIILEKTNVKGLIRLPNRTFPETSIKTTVLVLQKKKKGSKEPERFFAGDIEDLKETDELIKSFQKFVKKGGKA